MINNSYLLGLYGLSSSTGGFTASTPASLQRKQPTPPWDTKAAQSEPSALVRAALGGRRIVNEGAARLDLSGASADYRKLFALYQGLETLTALANRASERGVGATEMALLNRRFGTGLAEIGDYLTGVSLDGVRLVQGTASATSKTTAGVARDSAKSITGAIHSGSPDSPVDAFQGDVVFDITIRRLNTTTAVPIDLSEMGATPRTMGAVAAFINDKLEAAGFDTRFGREKIATEPKTVTTGGKTITLPAGPDQWGLSIRGDSTEVVGFTAPAREDAVYVVQGAGTSGSHQLLKFQADTGGTAPDAEAGVGDTHWVEGRTGQTTLPEGVSAVRASATGPDGSLWIVADMTAGVDGQPIKGAQDVVLMKLDSAGRVVTSRALGAASTASGYAIAVGADGRVAVAGSVTGALEPGKSADLTTGVDSFVTVFDAKGVEQWTQRRGARAEDMATAVSFGADGAVHVAGQARSAMPGATTLGGWDGYVQTFTETQAHIYAPVTATAGVAVQFGGAGDDRVQAMTVQGQDLYTAGVENGRLVVRQFTLDAEGAPTLAAMRDLGLASGEVAGIAVDNGRVIVTGTTRNDALSAGTINNAHSGGTDVFVAALGADLMASPDDRLTYYGGEGDDTAADVKLHDGKIWITGVADRPAGARATDPTQGYLTRIDPLTGAVEWSRTWSGEGGQAAPATLAVAGGGASILDRLGLPQGEIAQSDSKQLTAATSLRVGDRFYVSPADGGRPRAVTIDARDTLQSLARKIEQASNMTLKVTVGSESAGDVTGADASAGGFQRLTIMARSGKAGAVLTAGETGRDALAGLGLSAGFIGVTSGDKTKSSFGMDLPRNLSLSDPAAVKTAGERLQAAMKAVRDAYRALAPATTSSKATGPAPAYLTAQLANYQAALARLTG